ERDILKCIQMAPRMATAWWTLAGLRKQTPESNHVDQLRRLVSSGSPTTSDRAYLHYALHKELDDLGDIKGASQALDDACRARRLEQNYSDAHTRLLFQRLKELPAGKASTASAEFTPVFVVGMFRSGTTLLEQLMGGNPDILNAGELQDMASCMRNATDHYCHGVTDEVVVARSIDVDFTEVGQQYLDGVRWRLAQQHTHITDKWPPNHVNVGFICQALPDAKIIHMVRDPVETCFSNLREMFSGAAPYSYDQAELASYYLQYRDLMTHWHERFPGRILDVDYARLTTNTEEVMREVSAFCGFDFLPAMLDPRSTVRSVATASAVQVRNAVISRSKPKWEPYREYLEPLIEGLRDCTVGSLS
ncbi:MAG TPA: sulfotransferase, partial [Pseudoxanthomonas sp.]